MDNKIVEIRTTLQQVFSIGIIERMKSRRASVNSGLACVSPMRVMVISPHSPNLNNLSSLEVFSIGALPSL